jgi:ribosome-associated protein
MEDLFVKTGLSVPGSALAADAVKASGPGGQSVNKTNSACVLRAYVDAFGWPDGLRDRLLAHSDQRISPKQRAIVIQCDTHRSYHRNLDEARRRLATLIRKALHRRSPRLRTQPSRSATRRAVKAQKRRSEIKALRGRVRDWS